MKENYKKAKGRRSFAEQRSLHRNSVVSAKESGSAKMSFQNGGYSNGTKYAPRVIEVPLREDPGSTLEIDCETLEEDTSELCEILNSEEVSLKYWIKFAVRYSLRFFV